MADTDAKNYAAIYAAKDHHDKTCNFGGKAKELHVSPYDLKRLDWDEGEILCGLTVVSNDEINPGMFRVVCDGEVNSNEPSISEDVDEDIEVVTHEHDKELVPA